MLFGVGFCFGVGWCVCRFACLDVGLILVWVGLVFVLGVFCLGIVLGLDLNLCVFKIELVGLVVWVVFFGFWVGFEFGFWGWVVDWLSFVFSCVVGLLVVWWCVSFRVVGFIG